MRGKVVYVAGPMRGHPNFNYDAFDKARDYLRLQGYIPISPTDIDRLHEGWGKYPPADWQFNLQDAKRMIQRDLLTILHDCDAIYMLLGWEKSKGARVEHALAEFLGLDIMYQTEQFELPFRKEVMPMD